MKLKLGMSTARRRGSQHEAQQRKSVSAFEVNSVQWQPADKPLKLIFWNTCAASRFDNRVPSSVLVELVLRNTHQRKRRAARNNMPPLSLRNRRANVDHGVGQRPVAEFEGGVQDSNLVVIAQRVVPVLAEDGADTNHAEIRQFCSP